MKFLCFLDLKIDRVTPTNYSTEFNFFGVFMLLVLLIVFIALPVLEISLMIHVGQVLGTWNTVALIILSAVVGASLVRSQGVAKLIMVREKVARGELPGLEIVESVMLALAGVLLVLPGFITDLIGVLFITPFTRKPIAQYIFSRMKVNIVSSQSFNQSNNPFGQSPFGHSPFDKDSQDQSGNTFEGDYETKPEEVKPEHRLDNQDDDKK